MTPSLFTLASVIGVSLLSFSGISLFVFRESTVRRWLLYIVSFSTGAMLGDVFLHMIPEMAEEEFFPLGLRVLLLSIVLSFAIEKVVHWRHCHMLPSDKHDHDHCHTAGTMTLIGDGIHNFIDGVVIAAAFLVSVPVGVSTTLAVVFHEIPQEIGNFAVLLHDGYKRKSALLWNFLSALMAVAGAGLVLLFSTTITSLGTYLLPIAAGNFLYIAGADLIPELHRESKIPRALLQLLCMILGILVMYVLTFLE